MCQLRELEQYGPELKGGDQKLQNLGRQCPGQALEGEHRRAQTCLAPHPHWPLA